MLWLNGLMFPYNTKAQKCFFVDLFFWCGSRRRTSVQFFMSSLNFMVLIIMTLSALSPFLLKVKVCDLEQKCRSHSENFHQLSKGLLNFRLQSAPVKILKINPSSASQVPSSPDIFGLEAKSKKGGLQSHQKVQLVLNKGFNSRVLYLKLNIFYN